MDRHIILNSKHTFPKVVFVLAYKAATRPFLTPNQQKNLHHQYETLQSRAQNPSQHAIAASCHNHHFVKIS